MDLTPRQEARLVRMQATMKMSELRAMYWIAEATTGVAERRCVHRGNHKLTSEELIDEALCIANSHIDTIAKIANNIARLLEGREDEITPE